MKVWGKLFILLLTTVILLLNGFFLSAQQEDDPSTILINFAEIVQSGDSQNIRTYFTLLNQTNNSLTDPEIDYVSFNIDSTLYTATVRKPTEPLNIVIVIDTSGSINRAGLKATVVDSAKQAIAQAPSSTRFAVYSFNETIKLETELGFTSDKVAIATAIDNIEFSNAGTCLYDATFEAINLVKQEGIRGRRAIILFTDGRDEITAGQGDTCSKNADLARIKDDAAGQVSIFPIALRGTIGPNEGELSSLASVTGGFSSAGDSDDLSGYFRNMVNILSSQLVAEAETCQPAGNPGLAAMIVGVSQSNSITQTLNGLNFAQECLLPTKTPTPLPLGFSVGAAILRGSVYEFPIESSGSTEIAGYRVQVRDQNNSQVILAPISLNADATSFTLAIADISLEFDEVTIVIDAINTDGAVISDAVVEIEGFSPRRTPTPTLTPSATNTPSPTPSPTITPSTTPSPTPLPGLSIITQNFDTSTREFVLEVTYDAPEIVERVRVQIIRPNAQTFKIIEYDAVGSDPLTTIVLAESELGDGNFLVEGEYTIRVWVNQDDYVDNVGVSSSIILDPPPLDTPTPIPTPTQAPQILGLGLNFDETSRTLKISPDVGGSGTIGGYTITITNAESGDQIYNQKYNVAIPANITLIESDIIGAGDSNLLGDYRVKVIIEGEDDLFRNEMEENFTAQAIPEAPPPTFLESVKDNALLIVGAVIALLSVMIFFYWYTTRNTEEPDVFNYGGEVRPIADTPRPAMGVADKDITIDGSLVGRLTQIKPEISDTPVWDLYISTRKNSFRIGRGDANDVQLDNKTVSDIHAQLEYNADKNFYIIDQSSRSGTILNSKKINALKSLKLDRGKAHEIGIGSHIVLQFNYVDMSSGDLPSDVVAYFITDQIDEDESKIKKGAKIIVDEIPFTVGRSPDNKWSIPIQGISGNHFVLKWEKDRFELTDLNSRNGTSINGAPKVKAKVAHPLEENKETQIRIGLNTVVTFYYERSRNNNMDMTLNESAPMSDAPPMTTVESAIPKVVNLNPKLTINIDGKVNTFQFDDATRKVLIIGRTDNNENRLVITENIVSGKHAQIYLDDNSYYARDEGSTNGTFVNDVELTQSNNPTRLEANRLHSIQLGRGAAGTPVILNFSYSSDENSQDNPNIYATMPDKS